MPRPASAENVPRKVPKKRVPKKRVAAKSRSPKKSTPRKSVAKKTVRRSSSEKPMVERGSQRKAPTKIADYRAANTMRRKQLLIIVGILIVGTGGSAAIGYMDQGEINVNETIEARNERMRNGQFADGETRRVVVPVQNTGSNQPSVSGLVGIGDTEEPEPADTVATSSATSTEASNTEVMTASSTDETVDVLNEENEENSSDGETDESENQNTIDIIAE